jgi:Domain of unknown function (DUF5134)
MHHHLAPTTNTQAAVLLAEVLLFWIAAVLHLLRLLNNAALPDADPATDLAHTAMGAGMAAMLFPGTPPGIDLPAAVLFAGIAVFFALRALTRLADLTMSVSAAAMTLMLLAGQQAGTPVMLLIAACLIGCAVAQTRRLITHHRHTGSLSTGHTRPLTVASHLSAIGMTLAMAYLFTV